MAYEGEEDLIKETNLVFSSLIDKLSSLEQEAIEFKKDLRGLDKSKSWQEEITAVKLSQSKLVEAIHNKHGLWDKKDIMHTVGKLGFGNNIPLRHTTIEKIHSLESRFKPLEFQPTVIDPQKVTKAYETLGLEEGKAGESEIKAVYKKSSLENHPDKTLSLEPPEREERQAIFIKHDEAYKYLMEALKQEKKSNENLPQTKGPSL